MLDPFINLRPFDDAQLPEVLQSVAHNPYFAKAAQFVYPNDTLEQSQARLCAIRSVDELQFTIMKDVTERLVSTTMDTFTYDGFDRLDPSSRYLFVSNHRDICLDAILTDYATHFSGLIIPQITFGANLMDVPLMADLGRANKIFQVERGGTPREFYNNLMLVSRYIRHVITEQHQPVWIAQRNGRTKDGADRTDPAIVKMFGMSSDKQLSDSLKDLTIVPLAISYEWESCDILKAVELCKRAQGPYTKQPGEDAHSVITGLMQPKGKVHLQATSPITPAELDACDNDAKQIATLIDKRILGAYRLYPYNYVAADLLKNYKNIPHPIPHTSHLSLHYSDADRNLFLMRLHSLPEEYQPYLLLIYANPVISKLSINN